MNICSPYKIGNCQIIPSELSIQFEHCDKQVMQLKVIEVLCYLAKKFPRVVSREELFDNVWDGNCYVGDKALTNAVWILRKHLQGADGEHEVIETIRKVGYRLLVEPEWLETDELNQHQEVLPSVIINKQKYPFALSQYNFSIIIGVILLFVILFFWKQDDESQTPKKPKITSITTAPGIETFAAPSPDGRYVVYKSETPDAVDLYMQDRQQPQLPPKQLTFDEYIEGHSVWSNDQQYLYFIRKNKEETFCEVVQLKVMTAQEKRIADCIYSFGFIDISPDNKTIAFNSYPTKRKIRSEAGIYFVDLEQPNAKPVRFSCEKNCGYRELDMSFSPDGKKIAVTRRAGRFNEDIFLVNLASKQAEKLTHGIQDTIGLTWLSNGKQIIYGYRQADIRDGYFLDIKSKKSVKIDIEGFSYPAIAKKSGHLFYNKRVKKNHISSLQLNESAASSLLPVIQSDFNHLFPHYSAIHDKITYTSNETGNYEVWIADKNGKNREQISNLEYETRYPRWSHDGSKIAFLAYLGDGYRDQIYIFNLKSKKLVSVPSPFKRHGRISWSLDNKTVISEIYSGGSPYSELHQINIDSGLSKKLTLDNASFGIMISPTTLLYSRSGGGLWQKEIDDSRASTNMISSKVFKTEYNWTYQKSKVYYHNINDDNEHQIVIFDLNQQQPITAFRVPYHVFIKYSALSIMTDDNLLFTFYDSPQADIKMLEHPLIH